MTTTVRETAIERMRADELTVGQHLASGQLVTGRPTEIVFLDTYPQGAGAEVLIVHRPVGAKHTVPAEVDASRYFTLATDAEIEEARARGERDKFIAGLHEFADWLKANPWAPIDEDGYIGKSLIQIDLHGGDMAADAATVARVHEIANRCGVKVQELTDRTKAKVEIGSVSYSVIAWHKNGRPAESKPLVDPDASMEALYDAEADAQAYLGKMRAEADDVRAARADAAQLGLLYSREADDPTPVSPARVPAHVGAVTDGGLIDETECYVPNGFQAPEVIAERTADCKARHPGRACHTPQVGA